MSLFKDKIQIGIQEAELEAQKTLGGFPSIIRWFLILLVLGIIPSYYISRSVSQKIWLNRLNQGALTAKPSFQDPKAPVVSSVSVSSLGPKNFAATVKITNPNLDLSLDQVPYEFDFYNAQKQQIYTYKDNFFLLPNESKYLTVPTFSAAELIAYANFVLPDALPWQKRLGIPSASLVTSIPNTSQLSSPVELVVDGDFTNNSPYKLKQVRLTFLLFDSSNKIIGVSQRDEFTVNAFERRTYKQIWPNLVAPTLSRTEVDASTDTLDPNNLSVPDSNANPASDLSRPGTSRNQ